MSKQKKKNSDYNYKNHSEIKAKKAEAIKKEKKAKAIYNWFGVLAWLILIVVVVLAVCKFNGTYPNSEKVFMPLTGLAMILLTYKNEKLSKTLQIICYIIAALEFVWAGFIIFK